MQFIKSIFCLQGHDNAERFLGLSLLAIFGGFFANSVLLESTMAKSLAITLSMAIFLSASLRRTRDAGGNTRDAILASLGVLFALVIVSFVDAKLSILSLCLPVLLSLLLFSLPSQQARIYITGYQGPVDLSELMQAPKPAARAMNQRVEPSFFGQAQAEQAYDSSQHKVAVSTSLQAKLAKNDFANFIHQWSRNHRLVVKVLLAVTALLALLSLWLPTWQTTEQASVANNSQQESDHSVQTPSAPVYQRQHKLAMPDDYYLLLDNNAALIVHWQADRLTDGEIWSQHTAQGDDSCQAIEFNKGDSIRTLNVVIENRGDYYANFSPLDSGKIVNLLARRGSFSLCGYNFSLKGSQKALNSHPQYIDWAN